MTAAIAWGVPGTLARAWSVCRATAAWLQALPGGLLVALGAALLEGSCSDPQTAAGRGRRPWITDTLDWLRPPRTKDAWARQAAGRRCEWLLAPEWTVQDLLERCVSVLGVFFGLGFERPPITLFALGGDHCLITIAGDWIGAPRVPSLDAATRAALAAGACVVIHDGAPELWLPLRHEQALIGCFHVRAGAQRRAIGDAALMRLLERTGATLWDALRN